MFAYADKKAATAKGQQFRQLHRGTVQKAGMFYDIAGQALAYTRDRTRTDNTWRRSEAIQFAKYVKKEQIQRYLSFSTFDNFIKFYINNRVCDESWAELKRIYCQSLFQDSENMVLDNDRKNSIISEINRINAVCRLYWELARVKACRVSSKKEQKSWRIKDGKDTTSDVQKFVESYSSLIGQPDITAKYNLAIITEINKNDSMEKEYKLNKDKDKYIFESIDTNSEYVLFRAMASEEYLLLEKYFENLKSTVDAIYDTGKVEQTQVDTINELLTTNEYTPKKLPIAAHLGDFEQVTGYWKREGKDERVIVKFYIRKDARQKLVDDVVMPPKNGGEGKVAIDKKNHFYDKIGTKLEHDTFSYSLNSNKWAALKFLYYVDRIEVLNPYAIKDSNNDSAQAPAGKS